MYFSDLTVRVFLFKKILFNNILYSKFFVKKKEEQNPVHSICK